jgi:hypothetical protein
VNSERKPLVAALLAAIVEECPGLSETIKWNAPRLYTDDTSLLEWNSNIRATISFFDLDEFLSKRDLFKKAVKRWVEETKNL